jgi:hypothetical protein
MGLLICKTYPSPGKKNVNAEGNNKPAYNVLQYKVCAVTALRK